MIAALIVFAVLVGLGFCIAIVAISIMLSSGKLTVAGTNMRRLQHAKTDLAIAEMRLERERINTMLDKQIELRTRAALTSGEDDHAV